MDDATDMAWSVFLKKKSDLPERMINFLYNMRNNGTPVENIRLDNSGENNDLREQTNKLFMGIRYEFTAPNTPQQNGRVERKFSILYEYMRSILNAAKLTQPLRQLLWAEAANHSTDVINGICTSTNPIPPYRAFYNKDPSYFKYLRPFGELSVIASNNKLKSKMSDRGFLGLYLGREPYHTNDTYRFLNLSSHRVLLSRNVKFMNQMYGDYIPPFPDHHNNRYSVLYIDDDDEDDEEPTSYLPSTPVPATIPTLPHVGTNPTTPSPDDEDDDAMPELIPDTPSDLQSDPYDPFDNVDDDEFDFLPPPAPTPKPISTRLQRELRKLDGHLDYFKHSSKWSNQHAPRAGGESRPYPIENNTEPIIEEIENDDENEIVPTNENDEKEISPTESITENQIFNNEENKEEAVENIFDLSMESTVEPPTTQTIERALAMTIPKDTNPFKVPMSQLKDILTVPSTYEEAFYHNDEWCKQRWRAAIKLELDKMAQYKVWHVVNKSSVPKDRRLIKNKWVFDIKRTGIFRARLVACGYSQIPGIDFEDYYSPVVNDAVFRIVIILQIIWNLKAVIIDIETAFLHGELNESIYMLAPKGTEIKSWECVHLDKALYGLVQAARQFYMKFASVLKQLGFTVSYADPCLFYRNNKYGMIIMVVHIDDCYVVGDDSAITQLNIELHQKGLKTKLSPQATDYLSCEIKFNQDQSIAWIAQPTLMGKMIKKFGPILDKMGNYIYKTPGTPGYSLIKPEGEIGILNQNEQTNYRSGVGTLLQFSNKTRPDITNAVRELSRGMDKATKAAEKEMYRIMKYLIQTKDYGLKLHPTKNLENGLWT